MTVTVMNNIMNRASRQLGEVGPKGGLGGTSWASGPQSLSLLSQRSAESPGPARAEVLGFDPVRDEKRQEMWKKGDAPSSWEK